MYTKISELLDIYIEMSGEKYNINDLLSEINSLEKSIPELKSKIDELKESMTDDKYFDASSEIIDRNIELSLKKKITYLRAELKKLLAKKDAIISETNEENNGYENIHESIQTCQKFIEELKKTDKDMPSDKIDKLIALENDRYERLVNELNKTLAKKEESASNSGDINAKVEDLEGKIRTEEERLAEVTKALKEKTSYVNQEAKDADLDKLDMLNKELDEQVERKNTLTNSVTFQCEAIKDKVLNGFSNEDILAMVRSLTTKLNDLPYLNIEDDTILKEELNQLSSKRDELTAVIENKKYNLKNSKPYDLRYEYLDKKINSINTIKAEYQKLLEILTKEEVESTVDNLLKLKEERKNLDNGFANNKSNTQKALVDELIKSYEEDLSNNLLAADKIREEINNQDALIDKAKSEIDNLNKDKREQFEIENQFEREHDNRLLEETLKNIDYINNRMKTKLTPNQILDQIEMLLFENKDRPIVKEEPKKETIEEFNEAVIKNLNTPEEEIKEEKEEEKDFTFEKVENKEEPVITPEEMIISPDSFVKDKKEEDDKEFSFSPIDNTGYVSFDEAYNSTK